MSSTKILQLLEGVTDAECLTLETRISGYVLGKRRRLNGVSATLSEGGDSRRQGLRCGFSPLDFGFVNMLHCIMRMNKDDCHEETLFDVTTFEPGIKLCFLKGL